MGFFSRQGKKSDDRSSPDFPYKMQTTCKDCGYPHVVYDMRDSPCYIAAVEANRELRWEKERLAALNEKLTAGMKHFSKFFKKREADLTAMEQDCELAMRELARADRDPAARRRVAEVLTNMSMGIKEEKANVPGHLATIDISTGIRAETPAPKRPSAKRASTTPVRPARPARPVRPIQHVRRSQDPRVTRLENLYVLNPE